MRTRRTRLSPPAAAAALALLALTALAVPAAAAPARPTISTSLFSCFAFGSAAPGMALSNLRVVRDGTRIVKEAVQRDTKDPSIWFVEWGCYREARALLPGDVVSLLADGEVVRSWTVPDILPRVDPVSDRITGRVPHDRGRVHVAASACGLRVACDPLFDDPDVPVDPDGRWAVDITETDPRGIRPTDSAFIVWDTPRGDSWFVGAIAPYLSVRAGSARVSGFAYYRQTVHVTVRAADGAVRGTGTAVADGLDATWALTIRDGGRPVSVRTGDLVTSTVYPGARIRVIDMGVVLRKATGTIRARCWPHQAFSTDLNLGNGNGFGGTGRTGADGRVRDAYPQVAPLNALAVATVGCQSPSGNEQTAAVGPS